MAAGRIAVTVILGVGALLAAGGWADGGERKVARRAIETVLADHTDRLVAVEGVVGVAVGKCRGRPCIRVFVVEETPELRLRIPRSLEGYPVEVQQTGEFRAIGGKS